MSQLVTKFITDGAVLSGSLASHGKIGSGAAVATSALFSDGAGGTTFRAIASGDVTGISISGSQVSGGTFGAVNGSALTNLSAAALSGILPVGVTGGSGLSIATSQLTGDVSLTTQVSGILPIANGGTNASSAASAFANLSPMTTAGDIIYENATPAPARLAIGTSGQVLTVVSGLPVWQTPTITPGDIALTDNHIFVGNASNLAADVAMSGDATIVASGALTLATVNSNVGTFGDASDVPVVTVNGKGLITAISTAAVVAPAGTLSGTTLNSTVVSSSLTSVGTIGTGTWQGTAIGPTYGGTGETSYTTGDTLYASATNVLSKLPIGSPGQVLTVVSGVPAWAATAPTATWNKEVFTSISGFTITLAHAPIANSTELLIQGAGVQLEGLSYDYTVSGTTLTFLNGLGSGGVSAITSSDVVQVQYQY